METIEFKRNNKVCVHLYRKEYDYVRSISLSESKDIRVQRGIEKTFCIIKLFSLLNPFSEYVPIHCDVFKDNVSGKNYHRYRNILYKKKVIDYKESVLETYRDKKGKIKIKSFPMVFRCNIMTYQGCHSIFDDTSETKPIEMELTPKLYKSLQTKYHVIDVQKNKSNMDLIGKKSNNILATNDSDTYVSFLLVKMIKDVVNHRINSKITWQRRIREIAKNYQRKDTQSIKDKEIMIETLIIKIIRCLYDKKKNLNK